MSDRSMGASGDGGVSGPSVCGDDRLGDKWALSIGDTVSVPLSSNSFVFVFVTKVGSELLALSNEVSVALSDDVSVAASAPLSVKTLVSVVSEFLRLGARPNRSRYSRSGNTASASLFNKWPKESRLSAATTCFSSSISFAADS